MFAGRNTGDYRAHILVDAGQTVGGLGRPVRSDTEAQPAEIGGEHFILARLELSERLDHHFEGLIESFLLQEQLGLDHHARHPKMGFVEAGNFGGQQQILAGGRVLTQPDLELGQGEVELTGPALRDVERQDVGQQRLRFLVAASQDQDRSGVVGECGAHSEMEPSRPEQLETFEGGLAGFFVAAGPHQDEGQIAIGPAYRFEIVARLGQGEGVAKVGDGGYPNHPGRTRR